MLLRRSLEETVLYPLRFLNKKMSIEIVKFYKINKIWGKLNPPIFPFILTFLSGFFATLIPLSKFTFPRMAEKNSPILDEAITLVMSLSMGIAYFFVLNIVLILWYLMLLRFYRLFSVKKIDCVLGARKVIYFSTFYQATLYLIYALCYFLQNFFEYANWFIIFSMILLFSFSAVRMFTVFEGIRIESKGSVILGIMASILSLDAWYIIWTAFNCLKTL